MIRIGALGYIGVSTPQYKAWDELGPGVFALQVVEPASDGGIRLKSDDYHHRITVHPGEQDRLSYLGWEVATEGELEEADRTLTAAGIEWFEGSPQECADRRVTRFIAVTDPAGFRHELFTGAVQKYRTFSPPRRFGGFVTGTQGLGHVVVMAPPSEEEHQFLTQLLGFQLTDFVLTPMGRANFYHVHNSRHHSLAVIAAPGVRGLHHFMLQVADINDVGVAHDIVLERNDLPLSMTLGRHSTDQMFSFYVRTPSGFDVEYGWGAIELDEHWVPTQTEFPAEIFGHQWLEPGPRTALEPLGQD